MLRVAVVPRGHEKTKHQDGGLMLKNDIKLALDLLHVQRNAAAAAAAALEIVLLKADCDLVFDKSSSMICKHYQVHC